MRHRTWRDERGFSFVFVGLGLVAFMAATTLAIDVGMFMTARAQAQNSADAGAIAGATALVFDDYANRSADGPAVQNAVMAARANQVMAKEVSVGPEDVTFLPDSTGAMNRVRVQVYRDTAHSSAVPTLIASLLFKIGFVDVTASATGEASPANAVSCVKPFMIPDRWIEKQSGPWDPDDTFDMYDNKGNLLPNHDIYVPLGESGYTGYDMIRDKGMELTIRAGTGNNIVPTMYYSWKMPGDDIGGEFYRTNINGCNTALMHPGRDQMIQEPGDMTGPTNQGIDDLIAKDPDAVWDDSTNSVKTSLNPTPRIFPIPVYDPALYSKAKQNGRTAEFHMANVIGFFVVRRSGNNVYGRITPLVGVIDPNAPPAPAGAFPRAIRLVQ